MVLLEASNHGAESSFVFSFNENAPAHEPGPFSFTRAVAVARTIYLPFFFAGFAFGIYFVALSYSKSLGLVLPMVFARSASLLTLGTILLFMGRSVRNCVCRLHVFIDY